MDFGKDARHITLAHAVPSLMGGGERSSNYAGSLARGHQSENRRDHVRGRAAQVPVRSGVVQPSAQVAFTGFPAQVFGQQPGEDSVLGRGPPRNRGGGGGGGGGGGVGGPGTLDQNEILAAVESLYEDMLKPYGRILRKRLAERAASAGKGVVDVDIRRLRSACEACPWLQCQVEDGGDWSALHRSLRPNFVDVYSPLDIYPPLLWSQAHLYFENLADSDMVLPGGRYSCAQALMSRNLPFFSQCSLGQVCHIVQLAISQKKLLGYLNGAVVPYSRSQSMVKERCAESQRPCASAARGSSSLANWDAARTGLREILANGAGSIPLSNIKRLFRSRYHLELSETALGHAKLSELLQDEKLKDICAVRLHGHGYVVMGVMSQPSRKQSNKISLADNLPRRSDNATNASHVSVQYQAGVSTEAIMAPPPGTFTAPDQWLGSRTDEDNEYEGSSPGVGCAIQNTFLHVKGELHSPLPGKKQRAHSLPRNIGSDKSAWEAQVAALSYSSPSKENDDDDSPGQIYPSSQGLLLQALNSSYEEQEPSPRGYDHGMENISLLGNPPAKEGSVKSSLAQRRVFAPSRISVPVSEALGRPDFATQTPGPFSDMVADAFLRRDTTEIRDVFEADTPAEIRHTWVEQSVPMTPTSPYSPLRRPVRLQAEPRSKSPERVQQVDDVYNLGLSSVRPNPPEVSSGAGSLAADQLLGMHNRSTHSERGRRREEERTSRSSSEEDPHCLAATPSPCRSPVRQRPGGQVGMQMQNIMQAQLNARLEAQLQAQQAQQALQAQQAQAQEEPQRVVRLADLI